MKLIIYIAALILSITLVFSSAHIYKVAESCTPDEKPVMVEDYKCVTYVKTEEGFQYKDCDNSQVLDKNVAFADFNEDPCPSLPKIKTFEKPSSVNPEMKGKPVISNTNTKTQEEIKTTIVTNNVRFGESSICNGCESMVVINQEAKPTKTEPITLYNTIINFVKDCFWY